ncbi:tetratricopeptide repeat protein, partial [Aquabacterium sp. A08]|uniref:tetratricopeptide repeat protein n=1 Tax=Aquabacterium sp. A08 TaxID=2718532 RepID=UPI0014214560
MRWHGWLAGLCALVLLTACAGGGAVRSSGPGRDLVTESDEPLARKRARVRLELAAGYFEQGQMPVALDEVKQALQIDPGYADAYNLRALIYMRLNEPRLAEDSFAQALRLAPRDGDTLHNLGWMYCQDGRHADAT